MNKKNLIIALCAIVVIAVAAVSCTVWQNKSDDLDRVKDVTKKEFDVQGEDPESYLYMKKVGEVNLYYLGLEEVNIDGQDLLEYLDNNEITTLKKNFNKVDTFKDGGSTVYTCDDDKKCDSDIKVLFCNTLEGDRDVYIASREVELTADRCDNAKIDEGDENPIPEEE